MAFRPLLCCKRHREAHSGHRGTRIATARGERTSMHGSKACNASEATDGQYPSQSLVNKKKGAREVVVDEEPGLRPCTAREESLSPRSCEPYDRDRGSAPQHALHTVNAASVWCSFSASSWKMFTPYYGGKIPPLCLWLSEAPCHEMQDGARQHRGFAGRRG